MTMIFDGLTKRNQRHHSATITVRLVDLSGRDFIAVQDGSQQPRELQNTGAVNADVVETHVEDQSTLDKVELQRDDRHRANDPMVLREGWPGSQCLAIQHTDGRAGAENLRHRWH